MYIASICTPFPSHLGQMLTLLRYMKERGHRIELWGDDRTLLIAKKSGLGFRSVPVDPSLKEAAEKVFCPSDYYKRCSFPMVAQQLPRVLQHCVEEPPDVLHSNARVYTAVVASLLTGIPAVNHSCSGMSFGLIPDDLYGFCISRTQPHRKRKIMLSLAKQFHEEMDEKFHELIGKPFALPRSNNVIGLASERCVLVLSIPQLANPRIANFNHAHFTGPLVDDLSMASNRSDTPEKYCYVTLGTWPLPRRETLAMYREIIAGIPDRFCVVVGLGGRFTSQELTVCKGRIAVHHYAHQLPLIQNAEFVVCHGGCQTVNESLYFGKPILAIPPPVAEPREMVHKVSQAGACINIDSRHLSAGTIRSAVDELTLTNRYKECASTLGHLFRKTGGIPRATEILEAVF